MNVKLPQWDCCDLLKSLPGFQVVIGSLQHRALTRPARSPFATSTALKDAFLSCTSCNFVSLRTFSPYRFLLFCQVYRVPIDGRCGVVPVATYDHLLRTSRQRTQSWWVHPLSIVLIFIHETVVSYRLPTGLIAVSVRTGDGFAGRRPALSRLCRVRSSYELLYFPNSRFPPTFEASILTLTHLWTACSC